MASQPLGIITVMNALSTTNEDVRNLSPEAFRDRLKEFHAAYEERMKDMVFDLPHLISYTPSNNRN